MCRLSRRPSQGLFLSILILFATNFPSIIFAEVGHGRERVEADLTRPIEPTRIRGIFGLMKIDTPKGPRNCPVIKEEKTGETYRIRTYTDTGCQERIDGCKEGQICTVIGIPGEKDGLKHLFAEKFIPLAIKELPRKEMCGFVPVSAKEVKALGVDPEKFGKATKSPSGVIWGDIVRNKDGSILFMNHTEAEEYCKDIGARLPTGYSPFENGKNGNPNKDSDSVALDKSLVTNCEVMPSLTRVVDKGTGPIPFWTSTVDDRNRAMVAVTRDSDFWAEIRESQSIAVRCVVYPKTQK